MNQHPQHSPVRYPRDTGQPYMPTPKLKWSRTWAAVKCEYKVAASRLAHPEEEKLAVNKQHPEYYSAWRYRGIGVFPTTKVSIPSDMVLFMLSEFV